MKKSFDCVEMKRKGARKIFEALRGKSREEQIAYWRERNAEMRQWLSSKKATPVSHR